MRQLYRFLYIQYMFAKHGMDSILVDFALFKPFHYVQYLNPWNWFKKPTPHRGEVIRSFLQELGPIFVKFGQALSTRPDILPADIAIALAQLQENVPPFPSEQAVAKIESELGGTIEHLFAQFDTTPLASASIAQVHAATLNTGQSVVVKVLRPNIRNRIAEDLKLMKQLARLLERYWPVSRRFKPCALVEEFEIHLIGELDLQREGANAIQLRRNFKASPLLYVPQVYWDYTKTEVLVLERIDAIPVNDRSQLEAAGINIPRLAQKGVEIFFIQVFEHSFFHADMHPGNIFVARTQPEDPFYMCVDFGLMGTLSDSDQRYLAYNLYAFFKRDYRRVAELHIESGWVARNTRVEELESAIRIICEPIFEQPLAEISFALLVIQLFQAAKRFQMQVQPQLILLQKTLLAVEGLGKQLYPKLDIWETAQPFLEQWLKSKIGFRVFINELKNQLPFFSEQLPQLPHLLYDLLELKKTQILLQQEQLEKHNRPVRRKSWRRVLMGMFLVLFGVVVGLTAIKLRALVIPAKAGIYSEIGSGLDE